MNQKLSVIMSVYNGSRFLRQAIESILNQSFTDFEFIIIDDASTDSSLEIISGLVIKDERIKVLKNPQNIGLTKSLNKALTEAKGEYIARIDADDFSYPERFKVQVDFLDKNKNIGLVGTWAKIIDGQDEVLREIHNFTEPSDLKKVLIKYNPFFHSSIMIRKSVLVEVGLYDENYQFAQDYELYFRIAQKSDLANISKTLIVYRQTDNSITGKKNRKQLGYVIKAKLKAIKSGQYPKSALVYLIRPVVSWCVPSSLKRCSKRLFYFFNSLLAHHPQ